MFSFHSGPQPEAIPASELDGATRLIVIVPHWSATVNLIDNQLLQVATAGKVVPIEDDPPAALLELVVPAGAYEIEVMLDGKTQSSWVVAEPDTQVVVPKDFWNLLTIETSMPLPSAIPGGKNDRMAKIAALASTRPLQAPGIQGDARLSLFATSIVSDPSEARDFDYDLQVLDEQGDVVVDLLDTPPKSVGRQYWRCAFDLPGGYYVIRTREAATSLEQGRTSRYQPLYLCPNWETHLFLKCDGVALLASMSLALIPAGRGFEPDSDQAVASNVVLTALAGNEADRIVLGSERIDALLRAEERNPWLSVLAAYALQSGDSSDESASLLEDIKQFLADTIPHHPDVHALMLGDPRLPGSLAFPPMLRAGLRQTQAFSVLHPDLVVPGSPLARLGDRFVADSAWTAWTETIHFASDAPEPEQNSTTQAMPAPAPALVEAFTSAAPIYPLTQQASPGEGTEAAGLSTLAADAAIICAADSLLNANVPPTETIEVPTDGSVSDMLGVEADAVSRFIGGSTEYVARGLEKLAKLVPAETLSGVSQDMRATLDVLVGAIRAKQCETCAPTEGSSLVTTPIENQVDRLRSEASRIEHIVHEGFETRKLTEEAAAKLASIGARLDMLAELLLKHAHIVIITDENGELRYGNRLLRDRLLKRGDARDDILRRLRDILARQDSGRTLVLAADLSPTSPEGMAQATIEVHRTEVHDSDKKPQGSIYFLRDHAVCSLSPAEVARLETILPQITLHASMIQHLTGEDPETALAHLGELTAELDDLLNHREASPDLVTS